MSTVFFSDNTETFGGTSFALGTELEQVQRAAKWQISRHLPAITEQLQDVWDGRDKEYAEEMSGSFSRITLPTIKNLFTGNKPSMVEASLELWPAIVIFAKDGKSYTVQEDQWDTFSSPLFVEIYCNAGPVEESEIHRKRGFEVEEELDSIVQRMGDAVHLCIRKDPTLGGVLAGPIEKAPSFTQSLPWARKESKTGTGQYYIFQGKQFEYTTQKISY